MYVRGKFNCWAGPVVEFESLLCLFDCCVYFDLRRSMD